MHLVYTDRTRNREDLHSIPFVIKHSLDEHCLAYAHQ